MALLKGPALVVSDAGIRYRLACDELIAWDEIQNYSKFQGRRFSGGLSLALKSGISKKLRWRGLIMNWVKPRHLAVYVEFIDAPEEKISQAIQSHLPMSGTNL